MLTYFPFWTSIKCTLNTWHWGVHSLEKDCKNGPETALTGWQNESTTHNMLSNSLSTRHGELKESSTNDLLIPTRHGELWQSWILQKGIFASKTSISSVLMHHIHPGNIKSVGNQVQSNINIDMAIYGTKGFLNP